ncbi:hypothetical protein OPT61_g1162 [Boeremia exigua]|uniref:Uncharacterized protein n=1 Tax=Boeremia exigua TaxID=749465 RepID=A0ACC2IRB8_9PLEO|nr:hypothetical protein OPT61_g1162 [Boeremia exigua]
MTEQLIYNFEHDPSVSDFLVSKSTYLKAHSRIPFQLIATSALVLHSDAASAPRILLLQRASSDSNPNKWEPPGGAVDDDDLSILHAAARELWEEAGLRTARIGGPVGEPHFFARSNGDTVCRFNFLVHVLNAEDAVLKVDLDPKEHQNSVWATESEVRAGKSGNIELNFVREEVVHTILTAFNYSQNY